MPETTEKSWHWIWICSKLDKENAQILFEYGLYFWNRKNSNGFRMSPIESIDFFRRCHTLEPGNPDFRFYLARALVYRFINGERDEFSHHYNFLTDTIMCGSAKEKCAALYHYAMICIELEKLGIPNMKKTDVEDAIRLLSQIDGSESYLNKLKQAMEP